MVLMFIDRLRTRLSLRELELPQNSGKRNDFLKAWKLIKALPPSNPNSFWSIATYHGMPFKERRVAPLNPDADTPIWGGYCQHANVLFPTWHRFYCLRLEQALQTVVPDGDVALHYWDETSTVSLNCGIPSIVLDEKVVIDGEVVDNPLRNFTLPEQIEGSADSYYVKPLGYTTARYPYSGIVNPIGAKLRADAHNALINAMPETSDTLLQENVTHWLTIGRYPPTPDAPNSVAHEFEMCLDGPNYNVFSNNTSASLSAQTYESLEQPHNDIHLAVGGYTLPVIKDDGSVKVDERGNIVYVGLIPGSNGDMGANEVASFDPIFFLHHCNIDRMFWVWQKKWGFTDDFEITEEGANSGTSTDGSNNQGMTPNQGEEPPLSMDTILYPFQDKLGVPRTSRDCINIESQLGYTYSIGSLDQSAWPQPIYDKEHIISHNVKSWDDIEERLKQAVAHQKNKMAIRAFFDRTEMGDVDPKESNLPIFIAGSGSAKGDYKFDNKNWKAKNFIKVDHLDRDAIDGSFVIQAYYKRNDKLYYIGQRAVLDRWERQHCLNCNKHRDAAVGFHVDGVVESSSDMKNLIIHLIYKDPTTAELKTIELGDSAPKPFSAFVKTNKVPRIRFVTELKQDV